jgi:hypothetical protein
MMSKLDQRGVAAFEFCIVAAAFFILVFAIFDLGRYAITVQSLRKLANTEARAMMICCYSPALVGIPAPSTCPTATIPTSPSGCTGSYLTATQTTNLTPPFLFAGGLSPTVSIKVQGSALVVKAQQTNFTMLTPFIWPAAFNGPSVTTEVPF